MKLIEVFNTYQGEGPDAGRQMTIARHRECDRVEEGRACPWCDTLVKMRISCEAEYSIESINEQVSKTRGLMITGGEPTYGDNFKNTIDLLRITDYDICNIETNGHRIEELVEVINEDDKLKNLNIKIMYSPKFFNETEWQCQVDNIKGVITDKRVFLKFVNDKSIYLEMCLKNIIMPNHDKNQIWIMPEGKTREELIINSGETMDIIEKYSVNFSSRNHIMFGFV